MNEQVQQSVFDQLGGVLAGDKALGVEVRVNEKDMRKLALYIIIAMVIGVVIGTGIAKGLFR